MGFKKENSDLILKDESFAIVGAAMEVSRQLGCGFLEGVYQEALEIELRSRNLPFQSQKLINIAYKDQQLKKQYIADLICFERIIVEIKAVKLLSEIDEAQLLNYLKATSLPLGLLINFGRRKMEWRRFANTRNGLTRDGTEI